MSSCQALKESGELCDNDNNCKIDHYCWYPTSGDAKADTKKCMKLYEKPDFSVFGYKNHNKEFKYQMKENMEYGRHCKSGIAVINEKKNEMMCVKLSSVISNLDPKNSFEAGSVLSKANGNSTL